MEQRVKAPLSVGRSGSVVGRRLEEIPAAAFADLRGDLV